MALLDPLRRGAEGLYDSLADGWENLQKHSAMALTRFRRPKHRGEEGSSPGHAAEAWGLLASSLAETDDEIVVRMEAPGMDADDFSITVFEGQLVVRGEKHREHEEKGATWHVVETAWGAFERRFPLPCEVDSDRADAHYERGVLTLRLPRTEQSRPRRIPIESN